MMIRTKRARAATPTLLALSLSASASASLSLSLTLATSPASAEPPEAGREVQTLEGLDSAKRAEIARLARSGGVVVVRSAGGDAAALELVPYCIGTGAVYESTASGEHLALALPASASSTTVQLEGGGCSQATHVLRAIQLSCDDASKRETCTKPLRATLMAVTAPPAPAASADASEKAAAPPRSPWPLVLGGAGLAVMGGGIAFRLLAATSDEDLSDCRPSCPDSRTSSVDTQNALGVVLLAGGFAMLAGAVAWYIVEGKAAPKKQSRITPIFGPVSGLSMTLP